MGNRDQLEGEVEEHAGRPTDDEKHEGEEWDADLKDDLRDAAAEARDKAS
jgi:uncharacterized protein YjbJ (UPF0337 family)